MRKAGIGYYTEHGTFSGITNEKLSQKTTSIEYRDLEVLVSVEAELQKINKGEFDTEAEYYDALMETIYESDLSDKAKNSIGGYIEKLKEKSLDKELLSGKDRRSAKEIEKTLEGIKHSLSKDNKNDKVIDWKEILRLNKALTQIYTKYII